MFFCVRVGKLHIIIFNNFACNDTYPNIDGSFELVPNPDISRRPKQNFSVQIKGTSIENINKDGIPVGICSIHTQGTGIGIQFGKNSNSPK